MSVNLHMYAPTQLVSGKPTTPTLLRMLAGWSVVRVRPIDVSYFIFPPVVRAFPRFKFSYSRWNSSPFRCQSRTLWYPKCPWRFPSSWPSPPIFSSDRVRKRDRGRFYCEKSRLPPSSLLFALPDCRDYWLNRFRDWWRREGTRWYLSCPEDSQ